MRGRWWSLVACVTLVTTPALATPKGKDARLHFDRGVEAYSSGDYLTASASLETSYLLEPDNETLFAWAQTERKLGNCEKAILLYNKLLEADLPAANKKAIRVQIDECKEVLAKPQQPTDTSPGTTTTEPTDQPADPTPAPDRTPPPQAPEGTSRIKDPLGGVLVGGGVIALGVGTMFLLQGRAAEQDKETATTYDDYVALDDRAQSRGRLGVIAMAAGGALVVGGIIRYLTLDTSPSESAVTGWVTPTGGGIALGGRF